MSANEAGAAPHEEKAGADRPRRIRTPEENVRHLQARIVKAQEAGRWNKVKALQYLLTHSYSGKVVAVDRVTTNDGKKAPGVDGET
jgi:retron-type reverse transcriptase